MKLPAAPVRARDGDGMLPLINIVFLLMIFFMLLGAVSVPAPFALDPVSGQRLPPAGAARQTLAIAADGRLGLDGEVFGLDTLPVYVTRWQRLHPDEALAIHADAAADADHVLQVLMQVDVAGVEKVELLLADRLAPP